MIDRLSALAGTNVSRETYERLRAYVSLLLDENSRQNLIGPTTIDAAWDRHILDSAQLYPLLKSGAVLDIGSGAGLPGIVIAALSERSVTLCEPRRLRTSFLEQVVSALSLANVTVLRGKVRSLSGTFPNITARAVAPASELFRMALPLSRPDTQWVFPKGRSAQKELDEVRSAWQGDFRLEPSRTDATASILIATGVRPRGGK